MDTKKFDKSLLFCYVTSILYLAFFAERTDFISLLTAYGISSFCYLRFVESTFFSEKTLLYIGIGLRIVLIFSFPRFSDDVFRFFWDGKALAAGYNPFAYLPSYFIENQYFTTDSDIKIFQQLNSPNYYSIYPPVCQAVFFLAYKLFPTSVFAASMLMKFFLVVCDIGTIFLLKKINNTHEADKKYLLYALNPLCIIEICGNLHFEGAMIFFFVAVLFFLQKVNKNPTLFIVLMALTMALSVCSKLVTLLFLPILCWQLRWQKGFIFGFLSLFLSFLFFFPFLDSTFIQHFSSSLTLYFQKFEFNASLYYVLKQVQTWHYGFHPIERTTMLLSLTSFLSVLYVTFSKKNLYEKLFWAFSMYLFCQSTVHPWYLTSLVALSCFVPNRFGIIWSGLVFFSYSHYQGGQYAENYVWIGLEYLLLVATMLFFAGRISLLKIRK